MYRPGGEEAGFNGAEKKISQKSIVMQRDSAVDIAKEKRRKKVLTGCQNILSETTLHGRAGKRATSTFGFQSTALKTFVNLCEPPSLHQSSTSPSPWVFVLLASFVTGEFKAKQLLEEKKKNQQKDTSHNQRLALLSLTS